MKADMSGKPPNGDGGLVGPRLDLGRLGQGVDRAPGGEGVTIARGPRIRYTPWPRSPVLKALAAVWSAPGHVLGLLAAFLLLPVTWGLPRWRSGAWEVRATGPLGVWQSASGWAAFTLGLTIFYWSTDAYLSNETAVHERIHVRQGLRWGPFLWLGYLGAAWWGAKRWVKAVSLALVVAAAALVLSTGYGTNAFEREAYEEEDNHGPPAAVPVR